jgi:hypothetical protein
MRVAREKLAVDAERYAREHNVTYTEAIIYLSTLKPTKTEYSCAYCGGYYSVSKYPHCNAPRKSSDMIKRGWRMQ